jgi:Tol biopolymer transport system component
MCDHIISDTEERKKMAVLRNCCDRKPAGALFGLLTFLLQGSVRANDPADASILTDQGERALKSVMQPTGTARVIDFHTDVGTQMSIDVSPEGQWIVFDLLGHIYRVSRSGGAAQCLTQGSGVALNYHPRFSPDGKQIAFISDRAGQANLWIMAADGAAPRAVYLDADHRYATPVWARDGQSIIATRLSTTAGQSWHRRGASVWRLPLNGVPHPLLQSASAQYYSSSVSPDGQRLFFYTSRMAQDGQSIFEVGFHVQMLNLATGEIQDVNPAEGVAPIAGVAPATPRPGLPYDSGGNLSGTAEIVPMVSPDGRSVAFARAIDDVMTFRGHNYRHRTALYVRDLPSGQEHKLLDPITKDLTNTHAHYTDTFVPGFAWTPDSRAIVLTTNGKIVQISASDGRSAVIPFTAHVHRVISEQARRTAGLGPDAAVPVRFIQWPVASPDGRHLAFVALGRLWEMDLPNGTPRPLAGDPGADIHLTPSWSTDSRRLVFASWNARDRGQIWIIDTSSGATQRVSNSAGEYIWPMWSSDGQGILAIKGSDPADVRDAWNAAKGWQAIRIDAGAVSVLTSVTTPRQPLSLGDHGRLYFAVRADGAAAARSRNAYPDLVTLELAAWTVMSVDEHGGSPRACLSLPAGPADSAPVISPDGHQIAYLADYRLFAEDVDCTRTGKPLPWIDPDPNRARLARRRIDDHGAVYAHWLDAHTIEFAAGNEYVRFDLAHRDRQEIPVALQFPRANATGTLALTNAQLIPMDGETIIRRGSVVIRDGRIVCVGSCSTQGVERVLDLAGKTIIPGLIDVHDHIASQENGVVPTLRPVSLLALSYGVTTIIDPAVSSTTLFPLAEMTDAGRILGPRILGSAEAVFASVGGPNGNQAVYGPLLNLESPEDADYHVARRAAWGAVTIKNYRQSRREQQQWLIAAARHHGLSVTAEGSTLLADMGMVMDGQTGWEHFLPALPIYRDVAQFVGQARATYSPTVSVAGFPDGAMFFYRPQADLPHDPKYSHFASASVLRSVAPRTGTPPPLEEFSFPIEAEGAVDVMHFGGFATVGEHGENPGIGTHWEIWAYQHAMSPLESLRMATLNGARFVGIEHDVGSLSAGKLADLVVLNSDPLQRIENTADIAYVMKGGRLYDAKTLEEI